MRRIALVAAALLLPLAACGGSADESSGAASDRQNLRKAPAEAKGNAATGGKGDAAGLTSVATLGRATIRTSSMTVRVADVMAAARGAVRVAEGTGGYLESEQTANEETTLTVRVPPEDFTATSDAMARLGTVTARTVQTEDVTGDVSDVAGRLKAARASVDRVRSLLARANSIAEITNLESELTEREAALESLETRRRSLAGKTAYAALTVTFAKPVLAAAAPAKAGKKDVPGFRGGLDAGWDVFTTTVAILLVILGALLPFLAVGAAVGVPFYLLRRRRVSARA